MIALRTGIAASKPSFVRLSRSVSSLSVLGDNYGGMMAQLVQPPLKERMDTLLLRLGLIESRKQARPFLKEYEVTAASQPGGKAELVSSGSTTVDSMSMLIDGAPIGQPGPLHLVMNKLPGLVCTHSLLEGPTIYGALSEDILVRNPTVNSIGRLDRLASGLILLTQSGALLQRLTGDKTHLARTYSVRLQQPLHPDGREAGVFATGTLQLVDGHRCKPAVLESHPVDPTAARVTVFEGSHRLVRRMFSAVGNRVLALHRTHFGPLDLESVGLLPGEWRHLEPLELKQLLQASARPTKRQMRLLQRQQLAASREAAFPSVPEHLLRAVETELPRLAQPGRERPQVADGAERGAGRASAPAERPQRRLSPKERLEAEMAEKAEAEERAILKSAELCGLTMRPDTVLDMCEASSSFHSTLKQVTARGTVKPSAADAAMVRALVETRARIAVQKGLPGAEDLAREVGILPSRPQPADDWSPDSLWDDYSDRTDSDSQPFGTTRPGFVPLGGPSEAGTVPPRTRASRTVPARLRLRPTVGSAMQRLERGEDDTALEVPKEQGRSRGRRRRGIVDKAQAAAGQSSRADAKQAEPKQAEPKPSLPRARGQAPPQAPVSLREFGMQRARARAAAREADDGARV